MMWIWNKKYHFTFFFPCISHFNFFCYSKVSLARRDIFLNFLSVQLKSTDVGLLNNGLMMKLNAKWTWIRNKFDMIQHWYIIQFLIQSSDNSKAGKDYYVKFCIMHTLTTLLKCNIWYKVLKMWPDSFRSHSLPNYILFL